MALLGTASLTHNSGQAPVDDQVFVTIPGSKVAVVVRQVGGGNATGGWIDGAVGHFEFHQIQSDGFKSYTVKSGQYRMGTFGNVTLPPGVQGGAIYCEIHSVE